MPQLEQERETEAHGSPGRAALPISVLRYVGEDAASADDSVAVEEPLEIQLEYGPTGERVIKTISITMRTPGHDAELATGFLLTEGVLFDAADIVDIVAATDEHTAARNGVLVRLAPDVRFNLASLERNFYTTSSCGICGKASLLALRSVCPPRVASSLRVPAEVIYALPERLRAEQAIFDRTGGLHACGLFNADGELLALREDVGRHNALDKLLGHEFLADRTPLRDRVLLLSGRASFELLQKSVMAGIAMVVAVGAPSSLAVEVAREFDVTLIGFLRNRSFNVYHGAERILFAPERKAQEA